MFTCSQTNPVNQLYQQNNDVIIFKKTQQIYGPCTLNPSRTTTLHPSRLCVRTVRRLTLRHRRWVALAPATAHLLVPLPLRGVRRTEHVPAAHVAQFAVIVVAPGAVPALAAGACLAPVRTEQLLAGRAADGRQDANDACGQVDAHRAGGAGRADRLGVRSGRRIDGGGCVHGAVRARRTRNEHRSQHPAGRIRRSDGAGRDGRLHCR